MIQKLGFTIQSVTEEHGDNTRWRWYFVDLEGRFTVVAKNLLNLRTLVSGLDPRVPGYERRMMHLQLAKDQLQISADRFREKYELSARQKADLKRAILFLSALKRIHLLLGETSQAEVVTRKIEVWTGILRGDDKNSN